MPDSHFVTNQSRVSLPLHMHHTTILDVRPCANANTVDIAANHDVHPDTTILTDLDVADDLRAFVYKRRRSHLGETGAVGPKHLRKLYAQHALEPGCPITSRPQKRLAR